MMNNFEITFPDSAVKEFASGTTPLEIAQGISGRLAKEALAAVLNGKIIDLQRPLTDSGEIRFITFDDEPGKRIFWHSTAHVMAEAVKVLFPDVKVAIGPSIENGFYYDFDRDESFTEDDLVKIENKMKEIIQEKSPFVCEVVSKNDAIERFKKSDDTYKLELLNEIEDDSVTLYSQGKFVDLCRGPHIPNVEMLKAFKLLSIAGAYWRGLESNKMLQRIYGVSFPKKKMLDEYLAIMEEARKRDHRKLGKELDLFMMDDEIGPGLVIWKPNGAIIRRIIEDTLNAEHIKRGYEIVYTPHIARLKLWETSGHAGFYNKNMFKPIEVEGGLYQIRPMNCPFHIAMYRSEPRSYRDLPIRWSELGGDYRYERSGVLHGLMRVRGFTMDDAHIFCTQEQLRSEIRNVINLALDLFKMFGFNEFELYLSTRPEKFVGEIEGWDIAEKALGNAMEAMGLDYTVDPGEGAFYGPKIDLKVRDAIGRTWQCSTVQVDFNLPERFDLNYMNKEGEKTRPIMIHRAILGSLERFFGILIEHYGGYFPLWLAPVQVIVLPISEKYMEYAEKVYSSLKEAGLRIKIDDRPEKIGYKIREAETKKINYMLIVGEKESIENTVSVRKHKEGDIGSMTLPEVIESFQTEIKRRY